MRIAIGIALAVGLAGCVQETYYQNGVGFGSYEEYIQARENREASLAGNNISVEQTVLPPVGGETAPAEVQVAQAETAAPVITPSTDNPGISDEQDFEAVSSRETIESDRERLAAQRETYVQVEATALPSRSSSNRPNIVKYALDTNNNVGQKIYTRANLRGASASERACSRFNSADLAQEEFLASGGPKRDRKNLDPDGDGFACDWDPRPFRLAVQ
ncbi:hypothetical protein [Actibacterium pelagium]|uniref:Excalibur calcium-binding domain-containing protein n=1 Tax=Actibacterium pelagium TaxID=2029103 RepID=A0A917EI95_9RHOB|nr:hypothetical protein [Actibacterium pelagium]GGE44012.1 hypothetical protein GCM10011517_09590 [Actibacterium pelagium]